MKIPNRIQPFLNNIILRQIYLIYINWLYNRQEGRDCGHYILYHYNNWKLLGINVEA